jgi:glutaredoxin
MLKKYLEEKGVSFKDKIIDQDDAAREEMMKVSGGFLGVPFTVVTKEDKKETVVGFNKKELNTVLGL